MHLELGPVTIRTGKHRSEANVDADIAKARPADSSVSADGTSLAQTLARQAAQNPNSDAASRPASGFRPDPGPLPEPSVSLPPLSTQFQPSVNRIWTPRSDFRQDPFQTLKNFSDLCWPVRVCIETRKDQLCSLEWSISVRSPDTKADEDKLNQLKQFFIKPDGENSFDAFLREMIEEILVKDALTMWFRPTRGAKAAGRAALGADLSEINLIDGSTIKVLLDENGRRPRPPRKAYRQIIFGAPTLGGDYDMDEMWYRPRTVRTNTPYGMSPVETLLLTLTTIINRQVYQLSYYAEGNVPAGLLEYAQASTADQIKILQTYLDDVLSGNGPQRQRLKVVPKDSKVHEFAKPDWTTDFDEYLAKIVCAAMAVPPAEVGLTSDVNRATAREQRSIVYRRGVKPLARFVKFVLDDILTNKLNAPEYEFSYMGGDAEDVLTQARADQIHVQIGARSVDELRERDGLDPFGVPAYVLTSQGPVPLVAALDRALEEPPPPQPGQVPGAPGKPGTGGSSTPAAQGGTKSPKEASPADVGKVLTAGEEDELRKWRTCALKDVKAGKPVRAFRAEALDPFFAAMVGVRLRKAATADDVVKVFEDAPALKAAKKKTRQLRQAAEDKLHPIMKTELEHLGTALSSKLKHLHH